jgi:proteasome beta subunit
MQLAYGVLENDYASDLSTEEATSLSARAVEAAVERDTGSGNGVFLATISEEGVDIKGHKDFEEVR